MSDLVSESANFVLAHLLTKSGQLSTNDTRVVQTGLIETGNADFDRANGTFGPGTAAGVMSFLSKPENLHIVPRLSEAVKEGLAAQGHENDLHDLEEAAIAAGYDPKSIEGDTIESLIAQPYPLNRQEMAHLQTELHARGMYKLDDDEFTKFADGSPMRVRPNGQIGGSTLLGVNEYVKANPDAQLLNPGFYKHAQRLGDGWDDLRKEMATDSRAFQQNVNTLIDNNTGSTMSTTNYRLQMMLNGTGFTGYQPDGEVGADGQRAIQQFKMETSKQGALQQDWDAESTRHAQLDVETPKTGFIPGGNDLA